MPTHTDQYDQQLAELSEQVVWNPDIVFHHNANIRPAAAAGAQASAQTER
jgi:hypothetical protein